MPPNNKRWITPREAALKFGVSKITIYKWIKQNRLEHTKKHDRLVINEEAERPKPLKAGDLPWVAHKTKMQQAAERRRASRASSKEYAQRQAIGIKAALRRGHG